MAVSSETPYIATSLSVLNEHHGEFPGLEDAQSISGCNIDPAKLRTLLRVKFGGAYDIHIMQNSYCIIAPRKLSTKLPDVEEDDILDRMVAKYRLYLSEGIVPSWQSSVRGGKKHHLNKKD